MSPTPPPHLALGCFSREVIEILMIESRRLDLDATDIILITCVAYLSTGDALADPMSIPEYEGGNRPLPLKYCRGVIVKEISVTLNMNRETVRRRLLKLVDRNFLIRKGRYFFLPFQDGETDFTGNSRILASRAVIRMKKLCDFVG